MAVVVVYKVWSKNNVQFATEQQFSNMGRKVLRQDKLYILTISKQTPKAHFSLQIRKNGQPK